MRISGLSIFGVAISMLMACSHSTEPEAPSQPDYGAIVDISYSAHVQRLFNDNCTGCHAGANAAANLDLSSWQSLIRGSRHGEAIIPFDAENSRLHRMLSALAGGPHPREVGGDTLQPDAVTFLARWINEGAKNDAGEVPFEGSVDRLYLCNQNQNMVSIIDTRANVVIRNIKFDELGYSNDASPHFTVIEPDGQFWYVSLIRDGKVLKLNTRNEVVAEANVAVPAMLALHPTEDLIYVSRFMDAVSPPTSIFVFKRSTLEPAEDVENGEIPVLFRIPHAMVSDNAGNFIYTASIPQNQLIVIDHRNKEVAQFISLGANKGPLQARISPDDRTLYLSLQAAGQVVVVDISNPAQRAIVDSIQVEQNPWHPAFSLDGSRVYIGNNGSNSISVIDVATRTVVATVRGAGLAQPHGSAVSKHGYFYISNRNLLGEYVPRQDFGDNATAGTVAVVDANSLNIVKVLEVGRFASGLGIWEQ